jgi:hypothetical protein
VGRKHDTTVSAVALRWALQQPGVATVSVGCRLGATPFDTDGALQVRACVCGGSDERAFQG